MHAHYLVQRGETAMYRYVARCDKRVPVWREALAPVHNTGMDQDRTIYEPKDAAQQLDLSAAGLRRLAGIYERVYGDLPRDSRRGRLWPQEAIDRLDRARMLVQGGSAPSVEAALRFEDAGDDATRLYLAPRKAGDANLAALLEELRGLRQAVERQNVLLEEQGRRIAALEAPAEPAASTERPSGTPENAGEGSEGVEPRSNTAESEKDIESRSWWRRIFGT